MYNKGKPAIQAAGQVCLPERRGKMRMKTVKEVAEMTGISVRTLQYYDEIGLLKPSKVTEAGYRLYDSRAL